MKFSIVYLLKWGMAGVVVAGFWLLFSDALAVKIFGEQNNILTVLDMLHLVTSPVSMLPLGDIVPRIPRYEIITLILLTNFFLYFSTGAVLVLIKKLLKSKRR